MLTAALACGWMLALALALTILRGRARWRRSADAAHELRGALAALSLLAASLRREPGGPRRAAPFETQLDRMRTGIDDLGAALEGRPATRRARPVAVEPLLRRTAADWDAVARDHGRSVSARWVGAHAGRTAFVEADRRRLGQLLANLIANALQHGSGPVELVGRAGRGGIRVEVRDGTAARRHGRGLRIASRAAADSGGTLELVRGEGGSVARVDLPPGDEAA